MGRDGSSAVHTIVTGFQETRRMSIVVVVVVHCCYRLHRCLLLLQEHRLCREGPLHDALAFLAQACRRERDHGLCVHPCSTVRLHRHHHRRRARRGRIPSFRSKLLVVLMYFSERRKLELSLVVG